MTDRQFIRVIISLLNQLCQAANVHGCESVEYQDALAYIHERAMRFNRSRRRRNYLAGIVIWICFGCLCGLVIRILFFS